MLLDSRAVFGLEDAAGADRFEDDDLEVELEPLLLLVSFDMTGLEFDDNAGVDEDEDEAEEAAGVDIPSHWKLIVVCFTTRRWCVGVLRVVVSESSEPWSQAAAAVVFAFFPRRGVASFGAGTAASVPLACFLRLRVHICLRLLPIAMYTVVPAR